MFFSQNPDFSGVYSLRYLTALSKLVDEHRL